MSIDWSSVSKEIRGELSVGRDRFAGLLGLSSGKTVRRWEKGQSLPGPQQRSRLVYLSSKLRPWITHTSISKIKEVKMRGVIDQLVVGAVAAGARVLPDVIISEMAERLRGVLTKREEGTPHELDSLGDPGVRVPRVWHIGFDYAKAERFAELFDFGRAVIEDGVPMPSPARERFWIAVGVAAMRRGHPDYALSLFKKVLDESRYDPVRVAAYANLAWVYLHTKMLELARGAVDDALHIDPAFGPAIYNGLSVASVAKKKRDCVRFAKMLLHYRPDANDPGSVIGKGLLTDPDLEFFRTLDEFTQLFPGLSEDGPDAKSGVPIGPVVAVVLAVVVWAASPELAIAACRAVENAMSVIR